MNAFAWPKDWRTKDAYRRTFHQLANRYGHDRASAIAAGQDIETRRDLSAWRGIGQGRESA